MSWQKAIYSSAVCVSICISVIAMNGCRFPWRSQSDQGISKPSPAELNMYRQAVTAYEAEEYLLAAKRFEALHAQTANKHLIRMADYGLALACLMTAKTPKEYQKAISLWNKWVKSAPDDYGYENPMLMAPLVKNKMIFSNIDLTSKDQSEIETAPEVPQWLLIKAAQKLEQFKGQLASAEKAAKKDKERISSLEKQIAALKGQIKALETIDQKIQKKKNAIPSADSSTQR